MASRMTAALPAAVLILRLLTLALLAADKLNVDGDPPQRFTFKDVHAYRYVLAVAVLGCAYTLLHLPFAAVGVARRKRLAGGGGGSEDVALLLVVADVAFALLLAAGAGAGLGFTHDAKRYFDGVEFGGTGGSPEDDRYQRDVDRFFDLASASAGLMLAAAACTALMIILSVYSLVKSRSDN